jgi:thiosulfate/3-mercaptopyruvate sulfurtransferase
MKSIIKPLEYKQLILDKSTELVLIDARSGADASDNYTAMHLNGALHVDLESDLSDIKEDPKFGGRHPLPEPAAFSFLLGQLGIGPDTHVIVYDDKGGANAAARFWWMLRAAGHINVQVLDGGFDAAIQAGIPASTKIDMLAKKMPYPFDTWSLPIANMEKVEQASKNDSYVIIDVREAERYNGLTEPYDIVPGHIPNARNFPYAGNFDPDGFFLSPDQLREKYQSVFSEYNAEKVIVHCGSGVTACHTLLAMDYAGLEIPVLYTGSYSEWIRNHKPIITQ